MARRRVLRGVLNSFLRTYLSRNSDYRGYLVFGMVVESHARWDVDLLSIAPIEDDWAPRGVAELIARLRFRDQFRKSGVADSMISDATLVVERAETPRTGNAGGRDRPGYDVEFRVAATTDLGRTYGAAGSAFIAIFDPARESRRLPDDWGDYRAAAVTR